jgi:hypothetical protein
MRTPLVVVTGVDPSAVDNAMVACRGTFPARSRCATSSTLARRCSPGS